jgi:cardiolipin synthase
MIALLITSAQRRLWITTPYLLLDDVLESALMLAAQSGVDVRIVLPMKTDHALVEIAGEVHYAALLQSGVKLYRYMPGFMHAKMCLCDDAIASIGTVNLDFRSLYLHFEDGVILKHVPAVDALRTDMEEILARCEEIRLESVLQVSPLRRLMRIALRSVAPLM